MCDFDFPQRKQWRVAIPHALFFGLLCLMNFFRFDGLFAICFSNFL
jgi:hypothetical protein